MTGALWSTSVTLTHLAAWADDRGNVIEYDGPPRTDVAVTFGGSNNRLVVDARAKIAPGAWNFTFSSNNGLIKLGAGPRLIRPSVRVGEDARVLIGRNVNSTGKVIITAAEGATVRIGRGGLIASQVEIRADDAHAIFDVRTGQRVNHSRDIVIGPHVWLAGQVVVLGGVTIGEGSVVGVGSVVTRSLPNNVVAVGSPAVVVRRDVGWEPDPLIREPYYKPDASTVTKSEFWRPTGDPAAFGHEFAASSRTSWVRRLRRALKRRSVG